jgi:hypothetical protein
MNDKDKRIEKLAVTGCSVERIAARVGNPQDLDRVIKGLMRSERAESKLALHRFKQEQEALEESNEANGS